MIQSIAGQLAPELTVPYWIDAEGKERPTLTLKELGARHSPHGTSGHGAY